MPKGYPNNGINKGRFQKGTTIGKDYWFKPGRPQLRDKESYVRGTRKMVETRKRLGNYKWPVESKRRASLAHKGKKQPWSRENIIRLMVTGRIKKGHYPENQE